MKRLFRSLSLRCVAAAITIVMAGQVLAGQVLAGQVLAGQVLAEAAEGSWFPFKIPGLTTGSITPAASQPATPPPVATPPAAAAPAAPATPGNPPEWSGESGSSGHPLMT